MSEEDDRPQPQVSIRGSQNLSSLYSVDIDQELQQDEVKDEHVETEDE